MTERFTLVDDYLIEYDGDYFDLHKPSDIRSLITTIGYVTDENEQLKEFIKGLTTKGTGRIDLANGYSYRVSAVLTNWKGDVE